MATAATTANSDELYLAGERALKEKRYDDAIEKLSAAVEKDSSNSLCLIKRAEAYIRIKEYTEALNDANRAVSLNPKSSSAMLVKGVALFYVEEYESALSVFTDGIEMGSSENTLTLKQWRRKCNAALDIEHQEDEGATKDDVLIGIGVEPPRSAPAVVQGLSVNDSDVKRQADVVTPKTRYDWYQTMSHLIVTLMVKNAKKEDLKVDFGHQTLSASVKLPTGSEYSLELDLQHPIYPKKCTTKILTTKIEIKMPKVTAVQWTALEHSGETAVKVKSAAVASSLSSGHPTYPTSTRSGANRDWDKLVADIKQEEKDEKLDGEAGLNKFFRELYGNASEETKRAMNKSFVESSGTVLSTNWSEVGKDKVEIKPPDGMEFKSYEI